MQVKNMQIQRRVRDERSACRIAMLKKMKDEIELKPAP